MDRDITRVNFMTSVTVFCGSDQNPAMAQRFYEAGQMLAKHFDVVRFGGGLERGTMMGELAHGVLDAGGKLEGIISADYWPSHPDFPNGMTAIKVNSEIERNNITLSSDVIVIGPGQIGTLYEGFAALVSNRACLKNGEEPTPTFILDLDKFFNQLTGFLSQSFDVFDEPKANRNRYFQSVSGVDDLEGAIIAL